MNYSFAIVAQNTFIIRYQQMFTYLFLIVLAFLFFKMSNETWLIIKASVADAYIQVTTFVAGTLLYFYTREKYFKIDLKKSLNNKPKLEILLS